MNENLENKLSEVLQKAMDAAEVAGEFAIEQAPLLLQEFYRWHLAKNIFGIILGIAILLLVYLALKLIGSKTELKQYGDVCNTFMGRYYDDGRGAFAFTISLIGVVTSLVIIFKSSYYLTFVLISPKLYLIEHFIK